MVQYSEFTRHVAGRSGYAWAIHMDALKLRDTGNEVIMLTVGDPDQAPPDPLIETAVAALRAHQRDIRVFWGCRLCARQSPIGTPLARPALHRRQCRRGAGGA